MFEFEKALKDIAMHAGDMFSVRPAAVEQKEGHANFVTNIDTAVESFLGEKLLSLVPGSDMIGEEQENQPLSDRLTWIVDPVDGTTNLIHDYRVSAVSIALCENRQPVVGLVWQPYTRELFYAENGKGTTLNGEPVHVADTPFEKALVTFGTAPYYEELARRSMDLAGSFLHACADLRRSGSAAVDLATLACGRHDIFFEMRLKPWDYAAGSLLLREAGGCFAMPLLPSPDFGASSAILAATPACFEKALALFLRPDT